LHLVGRRLQMYYVILFIQRRFLKYRGFITLGTRWSTDKGFWRKR